MPVISEHEFLDTDEAISRAAREVVANALEGDFSIDPIVGAELARPYTFISTMIQRHGCLIQKTLADALAASGRFEVLSEHQIPVTAAANDIVTSPNLDKDIAKLKLKSDSTVLRMVSVDIVVIDETNGWAGAYDVKRGTGGTAWAKRKPLERDLKAIRLLLASHLKKLGRDVDCVTTGVIDYYGGSGFSPQIKIAGADLDKHFGVRSLQTSKR